MKSMTTSARNYAAIVYNKAHIGHKPIKSSSPENPERLTSIIDYLTSEVGAFDGNCTLISEFNQATEPDLMLVHEKRYIDFIKNYCEQGGGFLGDSTYLTKDSYEYALLAVGGAMKAADMVLEKRFDTSFALVRPPGHHASSDSYGGYCIFNNAAILARHLQKRRYQTKIMIIDWDVHAANGTMKIFYEDPSVMTISMHRDPVNFYPHNGFPSQIGAREGRGANINIVMPKTSGDEEYMTAVKEVVLPMYRIFSPDFVIGCNGFDAHFSDQFSDMRMTSAGYYNLVRTLKEEIGENFMIIMEGGYTTYNGKLAHSIIAALTGEENPNPREIDARSNSLFKQGTPRTSMAKNIKDLKIALYGIHKF
ncbi:MAG: histone deacetylase [Methanomassiliicoccales archaeon]|nr:MAG: histone deacetylase [Methanomassiliicoccales archaeon]